MRKKKKIIGLLILCVSLNASTVKAAENSGDSSDRSVAEMSQEELRSYYKVDEAAVKYGMDAEELTNAIYEGIHSDRFSPFSEVASVDATEGNYEYVKERGLQRTVIAYNQDSTMYLETGNPCASGNYPYLGCVAVHRKSSTDATPVIPFGTKIYYENDSVNIGGINFESFIVEDTGDKNYNRSYYWTDVYGGANTQENYNMAIQYGVRKVDISW